jgi:hypothetical protein
MVTIYEDDCITGHLRHDNVVHTVTDNMDFIFVSEGVPKNLNWIVGLVNNTGELDLTSDVVVWGSEMLDKIRVIKAHEFEIPSMVATSHLLVTGSFD